MASLTSGRAARRGFGVSTVTATATPVGVSAMNGGRPVSSSYRITPKDHTSERASVCFAERTGTAPVPTPHVLTAEEAASITSTSDTAFHDAWGGVKVRAENVGVTLVDGEVLGPYGVVLLENGIPVGDKVYYRPYSDNYCHSGPEFSDTEIVFDRVDGFHYLNYCTWGIEANDKCADFSPSSEDCTGAVCTPD